MHFLPKSYDTAETYYKKPNGMRTIYVVVFIVLFLVCCTNKVETAEIKMYDKHFNWSVTIPENFEAIDAAELSKMQQKGTQAIEKTYDELITDNTTPIFNFKNGKFNIFEAKRQTYEEIENYTETNKEIGNMIYATFKAQMPDAKIDTIFGFEQIDNLEFHVFKLEIIYPNKMKLKGVMYSRLFGNEELAVNITYIDSTLGNAMLNAWKNSKFGK